MYELLPKELIIKIYEYDSTYREKYNKIIKTIKQFPEFDFYIKVDDGLYKCHYTKYYDIKDMEDIKNSFYCTENYKKSFIIVAKAHSKSGTFK